MNFNIEMSSRYADSRPGDFSRSEDKFPTDAVRSRVGRASWPFLVGARRTPDRRECREVAGNEPSFSI